MSSQRQLVADASHELRTPLSSLRTNIQVLARAGDMAPDERARLLRDVELELDELTALVGDVVELARGAQPEGIDQSLRLDELDRRLRRQGAPAGAARALRDAARAVVVRGDPGRLGRAIDNLLDNAVKWSSGVEPIEVTVVTARR